MNTANSIVSNAPISDIQQNTGDMLSPSSELLAEIREIADSDNRDVTTGRFLPGNKGGKGGAHSPVKRVAAWLRSELEKADPADPEKRLKLEKLFINLYTIATDDNVKTRKEAIWAFNALMDRAYGQFKNEDELEAIRESGTKVALLVVRPDPRTEQKLISLDTPPLLTQEAEIIEDR